jgi:hypothetical protein
MSKAELTNGFVAIQCPGCGYKHYMNIEAEGRPKWSFNGSLEEPTISPSIFVKSVKCENFTDADWVEYDKVYAEVRDQILEHPKYKHWCHSFVNAGRIQFLNDCTHALAGQTLDLLDV